ncbi:sulfate transporter, partial [Trifolium medium]|nr:sulfate transporter [Trifolium medium]
MRVRERERAVTPRVFLGRRHRSLPSPEVRQIRGVIMWIAEIGLRYQFSNGRSPWDHYRTRRSSQSVGRDARYSNDHDDAFRRTGFYQHQSRSGFDYQHFDERALHAKQGQRQCDVAFRRHESRDAYQDEDSRFNFALQHAEQWQVDGEGRREVGVAARRRSRVGRSRVRRLTVDDNSRYGGGKAYHQHQGGAEHLGSTFRRFVSFYFTNFPAQLSNYHLRLGFEVCGMLEDVYVPKKRNKHGAPFGFVKFSNVRDVTKLTKALNDVWFGHFRVRARVASFDRFNRNVPEARKVRGDSGIEKKEGHNIPMKSKGGVEGPMMTRTKEATEVVNASDDVRVGDIVLKLGERQEPAAWKEVNKQGEGSQTRPLITTEGATHEKECGVLMRNYRTVDDDVKWAQSGLVATLVNGEAVPVVQSRINGCRVFQTRVFELDALGQYSAALQTGRLADSCTAEKDRLDFARVLIATSDLEIVNRVETVLVDGTMVEVKIMEEWGYALGEDTCLFEDDRDS